MHQTIINDYQQRISLSNERIDFFKRKTNLFSVMRLVVFACLLVLIYWAVQQDSFTLFAIGGLIIGFAFNWLVSRQASFEKQKDYFQDYKAVCENEVASITSHINIYNDGDAFGNDKHLYTSDLDIFGRSSLFELINRAATKPGCDKLADWLSSPSLKPVITDRQAAVQELGNKNDWKLEMQAKLLFANKQESRELTQLFNYLHKPLNMPGESWLKKYVAIAPVVLLIAIIAAIYNPELKYVAIAISLLNYGVSGSKNKYTQQTDLIAGKIGNALKSYADIFECIEKETWQRNYNAQLANVIKRPDGKSTAAIIGKLSRLINSLNARLNMILGFLLNALLVWDVRYVIAIEEWKRQNHESIEDAFDVIAEFEALLSLTSLHINNPGWCFPDIADGEGYTLAAKGIAHPLIKDGIRVANDYHLNNDFKIDIITGSNMAGKSTFLRTLGINTVLALCGGPVCAESMQVSVVHLFTYMRINDSLNESTSTFKAELDRLQMLLGVVSAANRTFFLIDEMLRGTNSVDKYLGSKAVIEKLISQQGVGLVATHDLQLAKLEEEYPDYIRNHYFDIQVIDGEMLFDYKIKDGECKTFNASMLLRQIGIGL